MNVCYVKFLNLNYLGTLNCKSDFIRLQMFDCMRELVEYVLAKVMVHLWM